MKDKGKRIKLGLLVGFAVLILTGCPAPKHKEDKLIIWHWMSDREDAFNQLAEKYTQENGLEVEFKLFSPPELYSQKIIAAARAKTLPDIFGILGRRKTLSSFIKAGYILDLSSYMNNKINSKEKNDRLWKDSFYPTTLKMVTFNPNNNYAVDPGIYGVPIDTAIMQFVYNKNLFEKAGLDPNKSPETLDEFITLAQTIGTESSVTGFICGWGEDWLLNALAVEWALNSMGENNFFKTIEGEIAYTDPEWIKVFTIFAKLKDSGILAPNIATMTNKEAESAFSKEKAVFSFNGSWSVNVYKQLSEKLNYGFFSLPKVSSEYPTKVWGGAGSSLLVDANSSKKNQAVEFLKWLSAKDQQEFLAKETNNLPAIKNVDENLPLILKGLLGSFTNLTHPDIWPKDEDPRVIETMNRGLQQIVMGLKTPKQVAEEIQKKKEKVSNK